MGPWRNRRFARPPALLALAAWSALAMAQTPDPDAFQSLLQQGFALHRQARFAEAIPVLEQARKLEPEDYFANLLLGIDLLRSGKAAEAVPRLKLAARRKPGEEFPEDYLGEAEAALGQPAAAAEAFEQALRRGKNSEQALEAWAGFALERFRQIGERLRASPQGVEVARRLEKAAASPAASPDDTPDDTPDSACLASIPLLERRLASTAKRLDAEAAYKLSRCYATVAGAAAAQLQTGAEDMAAVHRLRGDTLLRLKGEAAAAEAEYKQALESHPRDPALLDRLAEAQLANGNTEGARASAQAALAMDAHRSGALRTLAAIAMSDRDYGAALPYLRQLAAEAPGDLAVQVELGRALAQSDQPAEALKSLKPALDAGFPDEKGSLHALLGRVLRKLGRDAEAEKAEAEARRLSDAYQARGTMSDGNQSAPGALRKAPEED